MRHARLPRRTGFPLLPAALWRFHPGKTGGWYDFALQEEFDKAKEEMELHRGNFIKGVVRC